MIKNLILAGLGGFLGAAGRFLCYHLIRLPQQHWITLFINVTGSFVIGCIMAISIKNSDFENQWKIFLATGICGGFTTFSAFSYDGIQLIQEGRYFSLLAYALLSLCLSLAACYGGIKMIS